ncbi:MAG: phospho-sugar mutase [Peptococcaceae bacterium]|jgi:phosphoglucomutase|nr:phospho-sugar mutase [Peptococcaceae bacterium]
MDYQSDLRQWLEHPNVDPATKAAIEAMPEAERREAFGQELAFGTGGMRGIMAPGSNRLNLYTVQRAALGIGHWLLEKAPGGAGAGLPAGDGAAVGSGTATGGGGAVGAGIPAAGGTGAGIAAGGGTGAGAGLPAAGAGAKFAIACDTRHHSAEFAQLAACILAAQGIKVYLLAAPAPTPVLSFAIRHLGCDAGLVLTASHNPKEYNGLKVFDATGVQLGPTEADLVTERIERLALFTAPPQIDLQPWLARGLILLPGDELRDAFTDAVLSQSLLTEKAAKEALAVVYTPLHGAGAAYVRLALARAGFTKVSVVKEQEAPDGDFPTAAYPNPEDPAALALAVALARSQGSDIVIGTDPDSDRLGAVVRQGDDYRHLTGNQIGVLLIDYILGSRQAAGALPAKGVLINTIVTSDMGGAIARSYGMRVISTLTGFKYIGEQINELTAAGDETFVFGYEESNGYLSGVHVREKDAVVASLLLCEAAAYWRRRGLGLADRLEALYQKYGYYLDALDNFAFPGSAGKEKMAALMESLRERGQVLLPGVEAVEDYAAGVRDYPKENVLRFLLTDGSWLAARPSGTEPKLKVYYSLRAGDQAAAAKRLATVRGIIQGLVG